ncbi:MAG: HAD family hydrolase [Candidatus Thiodiazotropha sp. (ex. Lucinisca nassula)]|nr:HAD family hydrolase [Candidatus Thiodiazotropha sp. (ex. Lucinisca nassula)]
MHHIMFDVDGTLVRSYELDEICYLEAVYEVSGHHLDTDWTKYSHISDAGILEQYIIENGLDAGGNSIRTEVKELFTNKIASHLKKNPAQQVPGAAKFIAELRRLENLSLSVATGGWYETALMKLESAAIDISGIPIASSNNHFSRTEIMKIAKEKAIGKIKVPCTYFGDGEWDKKACEELGYNFVLVGNRTRHDQNIMDFNNAKQAMEYIGL